jgi:multidrug efflux pump subunit AcrB
MKIFEGTDSVVDVDWYVEDNQKKAVFEVDKEKASRNGISSEDIARTLRILLAGSPVGLAHVEKDKEPVELVLRAPLPERAGIESLKEIGIATPGGGQVNISELVDVRETFEDKTIYGKNLKRVVYDRGRRREEEARLRYSE